MLKPWRVMSETRHVSRKPLLDFGELSLLRRPSAFCAAMRSEGTPVSSGRSAIFHALRLLGVQRSDSVLVPTYHCPTLVAPVLALGAQPVFYPLTAPGVPDMAWFDRDDIGHIRAIIVPQLFGLPRDLSDIRGWCDRSGTAMVEDCAHSLFGEAGSLLAGQWGDFAVASLTKFLPVRELGWLYSSRRRVPAPALTRSSLKCEAKGFFDPLQHAAEYGRLGVVGAGVRALARWRRRSRSTDSGPGTIDESVAASAEHFMQECDLGRIEHAPALFSRVIARLSDFSRVAEQRRHNYHRMADLLRDAGVGCPLQMSPPESSGPYVLPLLVDDPDPLYSAMRRHGFPVYRWDRQWPGTVPIPGDLGVEWRYRLLQIPVHQSYRDQDFAWLRSVLRRLPKPVMRP